MSARSVLPISSVALAVAGIGITVAAWQNDWISGVLGGLGAGVLVAAIWVVAAWADAWRGAPDGPAIEMTREAIRALGRVLPFAGDLMVKGFDVCLTGVLIRASERELAADSALQAPEKVGDRLLLSGRHPPKWGQYVPVTATFFYTSHNFTDVEVAILVPSLEDDENSGALRLDGAPETGRAKPCRAAAIELIDGGNEFLRCWLYSDGRWSIDCPSHYDTDDNPSPSGQPGKFPADAWHSVSLRRRGANTAVYINGEALREDLPAWPPQANLRLRVTSGHVAPRAWFSQPRAWLDQRHWE